MHLVEKWVKCSHLLFIIFSLSNCNYSSIVHWWSCFTKTTVIGKRKVDLKVGNGRSCRGLPTRHWHNLGSFSKKRIIWAKIRVFGPKSEFLGRNQSFWAQKKGHFLLGHHVLATTWQSCANKKVTFSQIDISLLAEFGCFFLEEHCKNCECCPSMIQVA